MARAKVIRPPKRLSTASLTARRMDVDIERIREQVTLLQGHVNDQGRRIAEVEGSASYWAGLSKRVKTLEDEPRQIVKQADTMEIVWCFVLYTVIVGGIIAAIWSFWPQIQEFLFH